jgi:general secretion pathway protein I
MCAEMTSKSNMKRSRMGFTLIEVVVAVSLLAIAIVPILKALTIAYVTSSKVEQKTCSLIYAQSKLDEIRLRSVYNYDSTFAVSDTSFGNSYLYKVSDTPAGSDLRMITVMVGYDANGNNRLSNDEMQVTLATLIARRY